MSSNPERPRRRHLAGLSAPLIPSKWAASLLIVGLVARIGAALAIGNGFHFADEAFYVDTARRLAGGGGFGPEYSSIPAYPVFLALLPLGHQASVLVLRVLQAAVAAIGVLFVFALAERICGRRAAVAAGLAYALDPLLVITAGLLYPEALAAVLLAAIILLAMEASEHDGLARSAVAGSLLGALALLRPVALVLPPLLSAWIAATLAVRPARRAAHIAALSIMFALVLAPWLVRNFRIHRELVPVTTQGSYTAPIGRSDVARRGLVSAIAYWAWNHPDALVSRVTRQFALFWELAPTRLITDDPANREELHNRDPRLQVRPLFSRRLRDLVSAGTFSLELILALVGLTVLARGRRRPVILLLAVILSWALSYALFVVKLRYRIPVLPLLFVFTGAGSAAVYSAMRRAIARNHHLPAP